MAGKDIAEILKVVEFIKNGGATLCLVLAGHNLLPVLQRQGSRENIIRAFVWALFAPVVFAATEFLKKIWAELEPEAAKAIAKKMKKSWLTRPRESKERYYEDLIYQYRSFKTQGMKTKGAFDLDLEKIFVSLRLLPESPSKVSSELIQKQIKEGKLELWDLLKNTLSIDLILQPIVILGAPGTGKTTLMQHLCLTLARGR